MDSRSFLYTLITELQERDLNCLDFSTYRFKEVVTGIELTEEYIARPDKLSYNIYGTADYWWLLMRLNGIEDVWNDLVPGIILVVPTIKDMSSLYNTLLRQVKDE